MISQKFKSSKGSIYILLSAIFFGSYGIWSKLMADGFGVFLQAWLRGVVVVAILLPVGIALKSFRSLRLRDLKWFAIVTIPGSLVLPFYYYGFINLSMGTSTILFYSALTLTAYILGVIFFSERLSGTKVISLILGMLGLLMIFSFSIKSSSVIPALVTFAAGVCGGIEVVFTKKLSNRYSPIQLTLSLYLVDIAINLGLFLIFKDVNFTLSVGIIPWVGLIMYSVAGLLAFTFVTLGYKEIEPSIGGIIGLMEIIFGVVFGVVFFGEVVGWTTLLGGGLIVVATALPNIVWLSRKSK